MQNAKCEAQNAECEMQGDEAECTLQNEKCEVQSDEELTETPPHTPDTKAHLTSNVPRAARVPTGALTKGEMAQIREIFGDMDDAEIQRLYKRVTK